MRVEFIRCACGFEVRALMAAAHAFAWIRRHGASAAWKPTGRAVH